MQIKTEYKVKLGELLAAGHRQFGKVAVRRAYREEDDEGGSGGAELLFAEHPLLAEQPVGAASDLTTIVTQNNQSVEEAEQRADQANPELGQRLTKKLGYGHRHVATPNPLS